MPRDLHVLEVMPRLHFVTGKGGVGKSTIAAALAVTSAQRGARVLAIELGEPAGLCRVLRATPAAAGEIARGAGGTHVAYFDGIAALSEYITRRMHLGRVARPILEHPLYSAFVAAAPGLRELLAIGKIRDELVLQRRWDVVVVDAGATGHALEHLRMPAAAARTFARGRVHREASVNAALLRDPEQCAIHVVALPEVTPLAEAGETVRALRAYELAIGRVIVNRCVPPPPPDVGAAIAAIADPAVAGVLARAHAWAVIQEDAIAGFQHAHGIAVLRVPRLPLADGFEQASRLAWQLGEVAS